MSLRSYFKDKYVSLILMAGCAGLFWVFGMAFRVQRPYLQAVLVIFAGYAAVDFCYEYVRRKRFYQELLRHTENLDKKNLLPEMLGTAGFYEGRIVGEILIAMGKSMTEQISKEHRIVEDFKEYIEMWVHEIKLPLASMNLWVHNHRLENATELLGNLFRTDEIVDEILYFTRSETPEKDFLFQELPVRKLIAGVAGKYRRDLLEAGIEFEVEVGSETVLTDEKWVEFCLGQVISNAIKYRNPERTDTARIQIAVMAGEKPGSTVLSVWDNGIGIPEADILRIFEKSFTGENGRLHRKSTGMGLYIVEKLCRKMGQQVTAESVQGEYTRISICFYKDPYLSL